MINFDRSFLSQKWPKSGPNFCSQIVHWRALVLGLKMSSETRGTSSTCPETFWPTTRHHSRGIFRSNVFLRLNVCCFCQLLRFWDCRFCFSKLEIFLCPSKEVSNSKRYDAKFWKWWKVGLLGGVVGSAFFQSLWWRIDFMKFWQFAHFWKIKLHLWEVRWMRKKN